MKFDINTGSLLVAFYDLIGEAVVSFQIYKSYGDFYRSVIQSSRDCSLPFSQFPFDYQVRLLASISADMVVHTVPNTLFCYTFDEIIKASEKMDIKVNFNTRLFLERLLHLHDNLIAKDLPNDDDDDDYVNDVFNKRSDFNG